MVYTGERNGHNYVIPCHSKNTVANTINTTFVQCMMGKSGLIHLNTQWLSWNFSFVYSNWLYFLCNFYGMIEINNVNNGVCNVTCSLRSSKDIFLEYMENTIR